MTQKALGLIEVKGFLGAVVAADIALKAANVHLLRAETVKAGLKNVQIVGDVGAVRAAVDAVQTELGQKNYFRTSHVIARLDQQTEDLLFPKKEIVESEVVAPSPEAVQESKYDMQKLETMKVVQLRSLAYQEPAIELSKKEIKFANKARLLEALGKIEKE